jgi:hypothetical protein
VSGPYETDREGRLLIGKAGAIPADVSKRLLAEELVLINGKRWLRDSMLRCLIALDAVHEARSERVLVRTVTSGDQAQALLELLELAVPRYEERLGPRKTSRPLGLFVFPDEASFQEWCRTSDHEEQQHAAGFATGGEGFAVTFAQPELESVAVHEAAHLWFFDAYATAMPSWYSEGVAEFFGSRQGMRRVDGRLETGLPPTPAALAPVLANGKLRIPLADLLAGEATARINAQDGSAAHFYLESWGLYWFLSTTTDARFAGKFEDWEGFALGSRWSATKERRSGAALFDHLFAHVKDDLESAFTDWILALR